MKSDIEMVAEMDLLWLEQNDWTVKGNLAYRRILESYNSTGVLQQERVEQILMQYECDTLEFAKIQQALKELISLKKDLCK